MNRDTKSRPAPSVGSYAPPVSAGIDENAEVASGLEHVADLLEEQRANPFRVQAYRNAAATVRGLPHAVVDIVRREGVAGLDALPGIGAVLARAIAELAYTGRLALLDRLRAFRGFGDKRVAGVRDALATRLRGRRRAGAASRLTDLPPVAEILGVDREYREGAEAGTLPRIAPRRFNPTGERWLPVLHTSRHDRHYTALYSNTARAHELGKTHDWVVLYFDGADGERQSTVVTATRGPLAGRRVVRGREAESISCHGVTRDGT